eukprot:3362977-Rhodomonas_salina.1
MAVRMVVVHREVERLEYLDAFGLQRTIPRVSGSRIAQRTTHENLTESFESVAIESHSRNAPSYSRCSSRKSSRYRAELRPFVIANESDTWIGYR